ncbi:hypothetical protein GQ53DRAFT_740909 [Thozetella sp. PMI_491]|nr:hypothetical protein GQ53DRAFT_740909 [Thozetella sp. PMI_491]
MAFGDAVSSVWSAVSNLAPWHLFSYSALVGMELYQSFAATKIAFVALPTSAFHSLQKRLFPVYFRTQTALVLLTAITFPAHSLRSLIVNKADWIPFLIAGITAVLNLIIYGPRTAKVMIDRVHQKTRDGMNGVGESEVTPEMHKLNRTFKHNHAMSIHLNLISMAAMLFYGWRLASKLQVE